MPAAVYAGSQLLWHSCTACWWSTAMLLLFGSLHVSAVRPQHVLACISTPCMLEASAKAEPGSCRPHTAPLPALLAACAQQSIAHQQRHVKHICDSQGAALKNVDDGRLPVCQRPCCCNAGSDFFKCEGTTGQGPGPNSCQCCSS